MSSIFLRIHGSGPSTLLIPDLGVVLVKTETNNEFSTTLELDKLKWSSDLLVYATDDAYGTNASTVLVSRTNNGTAYTTSAIAGLLAGLGSEELNDRLRLERMFNSAYNNHYSELTYTGDNLTSVDIWEDSGKTVKLFTRTLSYTGDNLTSVVTTDERTLNTLSSTFAYSGDNLINVTKLIS